MSKTTNPDLSVLLSDPVMAKIIKENTLDPISPSLGLFRDIVETILGQQLSGKAANTIIKRFVALFPEQDFPTPDEVLKMPDEKIREAGTSWAKIKYIKNFCQAIVSGELVLEEIIKLSDEEIIVQLTKIKGIGRWTAEMVLIFSLSRPDVFSLGDLGLRSAIAKHYKVDRGDLKRILSISQKWSPHRTTASRYLWRSLDAKK